MAYTLGDPFRPLRFMLRLNGLLIGLLLGFLFFVLPATLLVRWGLAVDGTFWLLRLTGANHIALGSFLLIAAGQHTMNRVLLFTAALTHGLWALTLFFAYMQREVMLTSLPGQIIFVLIFALCLIGAVLPLRYIRSSE